MAKPLEEPVLRLDSWSRSKHQLAFRYSFDDLAFNTTLWYEGVDFHILENRFGIEFMEKIYFHIAAFDINKIASLRPRYLDWGDFAPLATKNFSELWKGIFNKIWAQWRYENDDPDYTGPEFDIVEIDDPSPLVEVKAGGVEFLSFCGGGKDSLVSMKLMERGGGGYYLIVSHTLLLFMEN